MKIGSPDLNPAMIAAEIADGMADRIREAHRSAEAQGVEAQGVEVTTAPQNTSAAEALQEAPPREVDPVGAHLRTGLEALVLDVIGKEEHGSEELLEQVVHLIVTDRFERTGLQGEPALFETVCEKMQNDPAVVAELDDILQIIAAELARR